MNIGLISDTHNFLDPAVPKLFKAVDHIIHAGDIGQPEILAQLRELAPVTAVSGNTDDPGYRYPLTASEDLGGLRFLVHHIVNPLHLTSEMDDRIRKALPQVVVFGHTHKPFDQTINSVHFVNPGYAGKARFRLPRSVALARIANGKLKLTFLPLA